MAKPQTPPLGDDFARLVLKKLANWKARGETTEAIMKQEAALVAKVAKERSMDPAAVRAAIQSHADGAAKAIPTPPKLLKPDQSSVPTKPVDFNNVWGKDELADALSRPRPFGPPTGAAQTAPKGGSKTSMRNKMKNKEGGTSAVVPAPPTKPVAPRSSKTLTPEQIQQNIDHPRYDRTSGEPIRAGMSRAGMTAEEKMTLHDLNSAANDIKNQSLPNEGRAKRKKEENIAKLAKQRLTENRGDGEAKGLAKLKRMRRGEKS